MNDDDQGINDQGNQDRGADDQTPTSGAGRRKDGRPFKEGNTRGDGSYIVGGARPPEEHRFRKGDGRPRGRRGKGRKNFLTEWREELNSKIPITENGKRKKVSKRRALIKSKIKRGIEKSDRAAETAFRYDELSERRDPGLQADDREIIETWLAGILQEGNSDDADLAQPGDDRSHVDDGEAGDE